MLTPGAHAVSLQTLVGDRALPIEVLVDGRSDRPLEVWQGGVLLRESKHRMVILAPTLAGDGRLIAEGFLGPWTSTRLVQPLFR